MDTDDMNVHTATEHASRHLIALTRHLVGYTATTLMSIEGAPYLLERRGLTRATAIDAVRSTLIEAYLNGYRG